MVVQKVAKRLLSNYWSIYTGLGDSFLENLQGLTTLKIYQADQQKAEDDACRMEHVISPESVHAIKAHLNSEEHIKALSNQNK